MLADKPLIGHIIKNALTSKTGRVVVSTNSETIAATARKYGAETPFLRPEMLSDAEAPSLWVILHALQWFQKHEGRRPEMVAYCPPTNPFTQADTFAEMFLRLEKRPDINSIVTITTPQTHPFRIIKQQNDGTLAIGVITIDGKTILDIERSQDWPIVWEGSPACRLTRTTYFYHLLEKVDDLTTLSGRTYDPKSCLGYEISPREAFDIDDEGDWQMAELLQTLAFKGNES